MKKKVLIITFEHPPHPGGIGEYSFQIGANLNSLGVDINTIATIGKVSLEKAVKFDEEQSHKILRFESKKNKLINITHRFIKSIKQALVFEPDLILVASRNAIYIAYIIKKLLKIPYVIMGHGTEFLTGVNVEKQVYKHLLNKADGYIVNSKFTSNLLKENFNISNNKINVIPLGADTDKFRPIYHKQANNLKSKLGLVNKKIILTVGRLSQRKGQDLVIKAMADICKKRNDIVYLLVGKGPKHKEYDTLIKKYNLEENVYLLGYISEQELPVYYQMCDIFILPSRNTKKGDVEGFGIVISEANLMAKPAIGTLKTGIEDAINNGVNGYLVPQNDVSTLKDKILKLLNNDDLRIKMGIESRKLALEKYNWNNVAVKTLRVFNEII